jgi:hypothetical protein
MQESGRQLEADQLKRPLAQYGLILSRRPVFGEAV